VPAPLDTEDEDWETYGTDTLEPLVIEYLNKLVKVGAVDVESSQIPDDPEGLIYLAATLLQIPADDKQALLSIDRASDLARTLRIYYRRELAMMQTIPGDDIGIFSLN
jgi:hypothetical protein